MYLHGTSSLLRFVTHYVELACPITMYGPSIDEEARVYGITIQIVNN